MIRSYVIHMEKSTARQPLVEALLLALPNAQVLPAVDGREMTEGERTRIAPGHLHHPHYPFGLAAGEIGCFLSHRAAWERIVASPDPAAVVAEDDIVPGAGFDAALALALAHATPDRLIRFPLRDRETPAEGVASAGDVRLVRPRVVGLTTGMQVVGRRVAARLLDLTAQIDRPVDTFLQMRWLTGAEVLTLTPPPVTSAAFASEGSTIQRHLSLGDELRRSLHRFRYRAAVARLSRKTP